ncbi:hypothetical protein [Aquimarina sp. RZ0]|uniref:hypothetical protein n=1 Tax=Aquimarina sp. RZ0 TaxID=2607730 RepID=UPI0011F16432|nr:hypothetical protein [Aquimarina sp. RZ0]KAA1245502.1 hypothetical protein F0000_11940 [Aquimarina sp. RZ0]
MVHRFYILLLLIVVSISCSEGDIIDPSVDFSAELQSCSNENNNTFVFYKIDNQINRSLSVNFTSSTFNLTPTAANIPAEPIEIDLNTTTNQLIYREFGVTITGDEYFCTSVPPSNIGVNQELTSSNGTIQIDYEATDTPNMFTRTVTLLDITLAGDGITIRQEFLLLGSDIITAN